ncbi:unnamed protein product [Nyctereutes procyonoides]|uniref:(raccoon dog) hypothetical protein n=1 Tax=Nyctereutes procyonoides TaxID=34880 RepID=A0A811YYF0_NYCPR|nr:unnamed protein product [Nyctereutes procyonoides]
MAQKKERKKERKKEKKKISEVIWGRVRWEKTLKKKKSPGRLHICYSGSQKFKIKVSAGPHSLHQALVEDPSLPLPASGGFWPSLACGLHPSSICLCLHTAFSFLCLL